MLDMYLYIYMSLLLLILLSIFRETERGGVVFEEGREGRNSYSYVYVFAKYPAIPIPS